MITEVKELIGEDSPSLFADYLREGDEFRKLVGEELQGVMSGLKALPDEPIRRALDF